MLINKVTFFLLLLLLLYIDAVRAQPDLEPESMAGVYLKLNNKYGKEIYFYTRDSLKFNSKDSCYSFAISVKNKKRINSNWSLFPIYLGHSIYGTDCKPHEKSANKGCCFLYESKSNIYKILYTFIKKPYDYDVEKEYFYKNIIMLEFYFKRKKMKVYIDFTDSKEQFLRSDITISFQEGVFEIKDPKDPKLIPIKKGGE